MLMVKVFNFIQLTHTRALSELQLFSVHQTQPKLFHRQMVPRNKVCTNGHIRTVSERPCIATSIGRMSDLHDLEKKRKMIILKIILRLGEIVKT